MAQDLWSTSCDEILQLEALKLTHLSCTKKSGDAASAFGPSSSSVLYELMIKPETSKLEETRRVAEIERRLEAIEKAVGATPDKMVSLQIEMFSCCYNQHVVPLFTHL